MAERVEQRLILECHDARRKSGLGDRFCVGQNSPTEDPRFMGCRFARGAMLIQYAGLREFPPKWWYFGTLDPDGRSFMVDKEAILKAVESQSKHEAPGTCPAWSMERVRKVVAMLPDVLKVGPNWKPRYSEIDEDRMIGVEPKYPSMRTTFYDPHERRWGEATMEDP